MRQYSSAPQAEQLMIDHIKFIAQDLFPTQPAFSPDPAHSPLRTLKPPIFADFDSFWTNKLHPVPTHATPNAQRITRKIYGRFRTEIQTSPRPNSPEEKEALWQDFLNREAQWRKQKAQTQRLAQLAHHHPSPSPHRHSSSPERQMTAVEASIRQLRLQTQQLKRKLELSLTETATPLRKTYKGHLQKSD